MERTAICVACAYFGVMPPSLAIDPTCRSNDEADTLCVAHRARATEGYCVLCGHRASWMSPWPKSDIGCCELCFRVVFGAEKAKQVAQQLEWWALLDRAIQ
jgi:hypothetical protein